MGRVMVSTPGSMHRVLTYVFGVHVPVNDSDHGHQHLLDGLNFIGLYVFIVVHQSSEYHNAQNQEEHEPCQLLDLNSFIIRMMENNSSMSAFFRCDANFCSIPADIFGRFHKLELIQ